MQGTSVLCKGQHTRRPVSFIKFSLLQATGQDEQLVREWQGPASPKEMVSWEQSVIPRQVEALNSPTRSWHAM